jgi:glycerol-3-phosphate dehydrogenase
MTAYLLREEGLAALRDGRGWDILIVGGGASGLGAAVDAAARGYRTLLIEGRDFASGTSSRSTKLIHGGVRYLRQGDIALVRHALRERALLLKNASHLVHPLNFVIPAWSTFERMFLASGLKLYDLLAGSDNLQPSRVLDREQTLAALPGLRASGLLGGILFQDGQFDDARLAIALMRTASDLGATCLNYVQASSLIKAKGRVVGAWARDTESGESFELRARVVINATGVQADRLRALDDPNGRPLITPSQGTHLVLDADFLPGENALLIPKTEDGRVLFAIPWQGRVLLGTTDTEQRDLPQDPQPTNEEVDFLLRAAAGVFARPPQRCDIRSAFAGLRPLLHPENDSGKTQSSALSREHAVLVSKSGMITVAGGKWTTYRLMAEQVVDQAVALAGLHPAHCRTRELKLYGCSPQPGGDPYGTDAPVLAMLPGKDRRLHSALSCTEAMVRFALRYEAARTIEDVLARRTRALFLDASAADAAIGRVAEIFKEELDPTDARLSAMVETARHSARRFMMS